MARISYNQFRQMIGDEWSISAFLGMYKVGRDLWTVAEITDGLHVKRVCFK
jgi:hypothetical protein